MSSATRHILCIDDDQDILDTIAYALRPDPSLRVTGCTDSRQGIEKAAEIRPDLILADMLMPGLDGASMVRELKADPKTADIPVAFLTAKKQGDDIDRYMAMGAVGVITKPIDLSEFPFQLRVILSADDDNQS